MNIFYKSKIFFTTKKDRSTGPTALKSDIGPYFEIRGQRPEPTINLKAWCHEIEWKRYTFLPLSLDSYTRESWQGHLPGYVPGHVRTPPPSASMSNGHNREPSENEK